MLKYIILLFLCISLFSCNGMGESSSFQNSIQIQVQGKSPFKYPMTSHFILPIDSKNDSYDSYFEKYTTQYFGPGFDYRWFKSQAYAESHLNPDAYNSSGASGIMQLMPTTYNNIQRQINIGSDKFSAKWNIAAGIFYDHYLFNNWSGKRTFEDRMLLTFASYNAGISNVLKAQKLCIYNCNSWDSILKYSDNVSSWNNKETISYINNIKQQLGI